MEPLKELSHVVTELPRGGYLVQTPGGYFQFGAPPETIKDTMFLPEGVPTVFVLPKHFFNWRKGISVAELEFPIYYNFFLKKRKTILICNEEQFLRFKTVFNEAVFGPKDLDVSRDYVEGLEVPALKREMKFFSSTFKFADMVGFGIFNEKRRFTYKGVTVSQDADDNFQVSSGSKHIADIPGKIEFKTIYRIGERLHEPFVPPLFGVTCLGPSHGFDPSENTSGFTIWLNHSGIMIDPPVNTTEWLEDSNVNPKFIDSIILTHCHADHDAGTFQKILEEGKITIYTTETVMGSFLKKYSALANIDESYMRRLFDFKPVKVGQPFFIHGGRFEIFYTLHSIPAIGFTLKFQDQSFVYSSDHNNDPVIHEQLREKQIISESRYNALRNFPWHSNVIYHESGIAPLHTPIAHLDSLPDDVKKRIVVYHISEKDFPKQTHLTLAKFGIENTLYFNAAAPENVKASQILGTLKQLDFFEDMPISRAQEFIDIVQIERYKKGDLIIQQGTSGDRFYIIYFGSVSVRTQDLQSRKIYGAYDYFGEVALVTNQLRTADVVAETEVTLFTVEKDKFLNFISGSEFEKILLKLAKVRDAETWNVISQSRQLNFLTSTQKTWLESMLIPVEFTEKGPIYPEGVPPQYFYIIRSGEVTLTNNGVEEGLLTRGDVIVHSELLKTGRENFQYGFINKSEASLYAVSREDALKFFDRNPGVKMKLQYEF
ncbi:cAMP/cGMP-dependent 3',5'-cyclic-AMP/GMP phosphodiesterase [Turneriella parva]|uniref:Transcriptional regulator, Crp/Fnr family n=1 Tax=Turneriella parva (strain ATCC BAA-1111 / DSM 21527 / NCTC 11395 / H) TaxID=869212 RepID=I4B3J3_TURPD|nr:cAMP/cGMP-dependent 3',5'-cyclic-AMP/GMP phosphodiesterase [Turneriella parva]AFM11850.1 putative transcriptional regulator, Crp/Fnr family [Turneriella parva DSM 21527]